MSPNPVPGFAQPGFFGGVERLPPALAKHNPHPRHQVEGAGAEGNDSICSFILGVLRVCVCVWGGGGEGGEEGQCSACTACSLGGGRGHPCGGGVPLRPRATIIRDAFAPPTL